MNTNQARNWQRNYVQPEKTDHKKIVIKVRKQSWLTKGEKVLYSFFGTILIISSLYLVSFSSTTDTLNRNLQSLEHQVQSQKLENESVAFEISELSKPERITKIAKENGLKTQDTQVKRAINPSE